MISRHSQARIVVCRAGADRVLAEFRDSAPTVLEERENFLDGCETTSFLSTWLSSRSEGPIRSVDSPDSGHCVGRSD